MSNELMELPEGWEWAKLSELGTLINGDRGKNYPSKNAFVEVGIPFINAGHLQDGIIRFSEMNYITEEHFNLLGGGKVQSNDILYCLRGSLGKTAIVKDQTKGAIASSLVIVRPLQHSEPEYLFNFLNSPFGKAEIRKFDNGSAQPNLSAKSLGEYSVPLPPLNEQKRIVAAIESLRERSQKARSALSAIPELCDKFRQSVLAAAFRGDITADWREQNPNVEPASVLLERIRRDRREYWEEEALGKMYAQGKQPRDGKWKQKYEEPDSPNEATLPPITDGWIYTFIEPILSTERTGLKTGPFGSLLKKEDHRNSGIPVLGIENISSRGFVEGNKIYIDESKALELAGYDAQSGDILISRSGTVGEVCVVPSGLGEVRISTNVIRVSLADNGMLPELAA